MFMVQVFANRASLEILSLKLWFEPSIIKFMVRFLANYFFMVEILANICMVQFYLFRFMVTGFATFF